MVECGGYDICDQCASGQPADADMEAEREGEAEAEAEAGADMEVEPEVQAEAGTEAEVEAGAEAAAEPEDVAEAVAVAEAAQYGRRRKDTGMGGGYPGEEREAPGSASKSSEAKEMRKSARASQRQRKPNSLFPE